jgi:uncharacterized coiled-coil protein SlyX
MIQEMQERMIELESQIAYLQYQYDGLNEAVLRQAEELDQIKKQLQQALRIIENSNATGPADDPAEEPPPPHY